MSQILSRHNFSFSDALQLADSDQQKELKHFEIFKGDLYLSTGSSTRNTLHFFSDHRELTFTQSPIGQTTQFSIQSPKFDSKIRTVSGAVHGSLAGTFQKSSLPPLVMMRFLDAFWFDFSPAKVLKAGDTFSLVIEELWRHGTFVRFGKIIEAQLGLENQSRLVHRKLIAKDIYSSFVDPQDPFDRDRVFYLPVPELQISSLFSRGRVHPITKRRIAHQGIDFDLPKGTPVFSVQEGVIVKMITKGRGGKAIAIQHPNQHVSYYLHLDEFADEVALGTAVGVGQQIGKIGCTGLCTKPHLHFGIKHKGKWIDPLKVLKRFPFQLETLLGQLGSETDTYKL